MRCCGAVEIRHKCVDEVSLEGKEIKNTVVITFAFQVVFTAFNALQNLHSSLHDEESLGNISLAILYGTSIISSIFSPTLIGLVGAKTAIVASFAAHCIYVLANFYPSFSTMAPAAVALGAFHGPAWTSQALYISASAFSFSKSSSASPYSILSRFNGFFFAVFATAQILGNLVTSTIIRDGVSNSTAGVDKLCGPDDCPHSENATMIEDPEEWVLDITLGFLMACALLGLFLIIFLLTPLPRSEWIQHVSVRDTATSCFRVLMSTKMMLLVPLIFFTAAEHAFLMSAYTKSYVACPIGIHMVGYVMAVYGVTTPAFVYIFSLLARVTGRFILLMLSMITHIFLFIVLFRWSPTAGDKAVIFIIPIVWGVAESILQAQANALIAMLFPSQKEPAFANFHAWRSLGYAITFLNASYMCVSTKLIVCMTFAGVGTVLYIFVEFKAEIKKKLAFRRSRPSMVSVQSEVYTQSAKQDTIQMTDLSKDMNAVSLQSLQNRLSFDRVELTDIIMEAQQGWTRDEKGLTLEIGKVMSQEHLAGSKVTNWYHTGPVIWGFQDASDIRTAIQSGIPRSLSDGHLLHSADKMDESLHKVRRDRLYTYSGKETRKNTSTVNKRLTSDGVLRSFDDIPEDTYEDALTIDNETETFNRTDDKCGFVLEHPGDDLDEEATKEVMEYRKMMRRLSETFSDDRLSSRNRELVACYQTSLSYGSHESQGFESDIDDPCYDEDIVFTYGSSIPSAYGVENKAFESDEGDITNGLAALNNSHVSSDKRAKRLSSNDHGYLSQNSDDTGSHTWDVNNTSAVLLVPETGPTKEVNKFSKGKMFSVLRALRRTKKTNTNDIINTSNLSQNEQTQDVSGVEVKEDSHSDADSNGFADCELEEQNHSTNDFIELDRSTRKGLIPINETEDVTCIY